MLVRAERSVPKRREIFPLAKPKYMPKAAYLDTPLEVVQHDPSDDWLLVVSCDNVGARSSASSS